jgi:hypothetical protein
VASVLEPLNPVVALLRQAPQSTALTRDLSTSVTDGNLVRPLDPRRCARRERQTAQLVPPSGWRRPRPPKDSWELVFTVLGFLREGSRGSRRWKR